MTDIEVQEAVATAIDTLRSESPALAFGAVHERSTAHRLAVHLEQHFNTWNVDCEYDRDDQLRKTLIGIANCHPRKTTHEILPDIIVHHRGNEGRDHNLLVIEIKRNAETDACDHRKLELLTGDEGHYRYQLGVYINIRGGHFDCTWYKEGKRSG